MGKLMFYYFREKLLYYGLMAFAGLIIILSNLMPIAAGLAISGVAFAGGMVVLVISFFANYIGDFVGHDAKLLFLTPTSTSKFMTSRYLGIACEGLLFLSLVALPYIAFSPVPAIGEMSQLAFQLLPAWDILFFVLTFVITIATWVTILYLVGMVLGIFDFGTFLSIVFAIIGVTIIYNIWQWVLAIPLMIMGNPIFSAASGGPLGWVFGMHISTGASIAVYFVVNIALIVATVFATIHILENHVSIVEE